MSKLTYRDELVARYAMPEALSEASLGRIYQHYKKSGEKSFAMLTAWKNGVSKDQNEKNMKTLKQMLQSAGHGYISMRGQWKDPKGEIHGEPSFFVIGISKDEAIKIGEKFNQDAVVYSGPDTQGKVLVINQDGSSFDIGTFHPQKVADIYSSLKGHPFTFESSSLDNSFFTQVGISALRKTLEEASEEDLKLMAQELDLKLKMISY